VIGSLLRVDRSVAELPRNAALVADWPLTDRDSELARLDRFARSTVAASAVVAGPEGAGKTRLAREYVLRAHEARRATRWVSATPGAAEVPYGALSALLSGRVPAGDAPQSRHEVIRLLLATMGHGPLGVHPTLVVDDAHLLDSASADVIHHLASAGRVGVIATIRSDQRAPVPITALWKDGLAERIDLDYLTDSAIQALVACALGGHVDPGLVAEVAGRSQRNLLHLRELVVGAVSDGALAELDGVWRLIKPLKPSARLSELIDVRLGLLSADERSLLEHLAYGEPLGLRELAIVGDIDLVEGLEQQGLLQSRVSGERLELGLTRPLDRDVLRLRMSAIRRAAVARSLADAVETCGPGGAGDALRIAAWRLEGGGASPEQLLSAAWTARWRYEFPLASRLVEAAVASGGGFEARLLGAQLIALQGDPLGSEAKLAQLARLGENDAERTRAVIARARNLIFGLGQVQRALGVVDHALDTVADPTWRDELMACRTGLLLVTVGPDATIRAAEPLLQRTGGSALVYVELAASFSLGRAGRLTDALAVEARGHAAHGALSESMDWYRWLHLFAKCEALSASGRLMESESLARQQYQEGLTHGSTEQRAFFAYQLARTALSRGHINEAIKHAREAVIHFRDLGRHYYAQAMLVEVGLGLALGGHAAAATAALAKIEGPPVSWAQVELPIAEAWIAIADGDQVGARRLMASAAQRGEDLGDLVGAVEALHGLARIGYPDQAAAPLEHLAKSVEGSLVQARLRHTLALQSGDANDLGVVSGLFEEMGADLLAAEAAADEASRWTQLGEGRRARAAASRAAECATCCRGAATPALGNVDVRAQLTVTELEAAQLAGSGRSNKQIAETLNLSVRTVENRLQRVYNKVGVSTRVELAEALSRRKLALRS